MTDQRVRNTMAITRHRDGRTSVAVLLALIALAVGVYAGARWHEPIARTLKITSATTTSGKESPESTQLWTCGMHPQVIQDHPGTCPICGMQLTPMASAGAGGADSGIVTIDPAIVQNMGVRVAAVKRQPLHATIRAAGFLREADPNVHEVNLRVSGWVERLHADTLGMTIGKGQRLFDLYSPELQSAIGELIAARHAAGAAAASETRPASPLISSGTLLAAARRKLQLFGLGDEQIAALEQREQPPLSVTFRSDADGILAAKPIVQGAAVKAGDMALRIVDYSTLWLDAQIFPQHMSHVREGQSVRAIIESSPASASDSSGEGNREVDGRIIFISPQIDPTTRAATVRMQVSNDDLSLRPGMWATARLERVVADDALVVPREAIIDTGERQLAFVALDGGRFEPRDLRLGSSADDGVVQILSGLNEGEQVVISGQFLIDSESRLREAIQKHLHEGHVPASSEPAASAGETLAGAPMKPQQPFADAAAQWRPEVDVAARAYLKIADAFGAPQPPAQPIDPADMLHAAQALLAAAGEEVQPLAQSLVKEAEAFATAPADGQRERFKPLSDAMISLMQRVPPSSAVADRLVVVHCPMAPGNWLQIVDAIANPYYATEMKQCGEITGYIPATPDLGAGGKP